MLSISDFIDELDGKFLMLSKQTGENTQYLELAEKINDIRQDISDVQKKSKSAIEASRWLHDRRTWLVESMSKFIFDEFFRVKGEEHIVISIDGYNDFQADLNKLLLWITSYLAAGGMTPKIFRRLDLMLPVKYAIYKKAFLYIRNEKIGFADRSVISTDALEIMITYVNRYLINGECQEI